MLLAPSGTARAADPDTDEMLAKLGRPGDFSLAPPDVSDAAPSGWYLRADAGYVAATGAAVSYGGLPTGLNLSGSGWSAGAGVGYRVTSFLRAEGSIDYLALGSAQRGLVQLGSSATVALASLYWDVVNLSGFTPYLSAGAGFAIDRLDAPAALRPAGNDWQFAWSVGAGVSYALNSDVSLDLGYRYVDLGAPAYAGGLAVDDAAAHQVRFGVRYMLK
ncbi:porin family protein [Xanthobacter dioxanivorans]|uniref:Porin family protein n=1 Tax=Xanthobacter dioxanivorans TaxID=2528964 RepID=A0A974PQF9_9HYPH|nr:outer membrane beta-barrel protein [Xanthobacter dioxanivorans]QRG07503.1 porin family protein [Xanthobacter dioxanivorans]